MRRRPQPTLAALGLPASLADLVKPARGLVLVCGPTGAGKASTLAALVGEMRDLETIAIALTAAETGHLVLSTLHTADALQAIHRVVDVFPALQQRQVRQQLALALHAIVCQQLVPRADGRGRVPAVEVLLANHAVRQHIRRERMENLHTEITLGKRVGMISLEESLARLVRAGTVALEEAQVRATHVNERESLLRG